MLWPMLILGNVMWFCQVTCNILDLEYFVVSESHTHTKCCLDAFSCNLEIKILKIPPGASSNHWIYAYLLVFLWSTPILHI